METMTAKNAIKVVNGIRYKELRDLWVSENYKERTSKGIIVVQEVRDKDFNLIKKYNVDVEGIICK